MRKLLYKIKPPCPKCLYTLGQVYTFTNPSPECKENGYRMYDWFLREIKRAREQIEKGYFDGNK